MRSFWSKCSIIFLLHSLCSKSTSILQLSPFVCPIHQYLLQPYLQSCEKLRLSNILFNEKHSNSVNSAAAMDFLGIQCHVCMKWRFVPTMEKYEAIREKITEFPFSCERGREWNPKLSCDVPNDIEPQQDGSSRRWAIDRPNIPRTPTGWDRVLKLRDRRDSRMADVYYYSPCGKKLRTKAEIARYLDQNPHQRVGITLDSFSFETPMLLELSEAAEGGDIEAEEPNESSGTSSDEDPTWLEEDDVL